MRLCIWQFVDLQKLHVDKALEVAQTVEMFSTLEYTLGICAVFHLTSISGT